MTLVFLHIDKTGGMSVRETLARQFAYTEIMPVPHNPNASEKWIDYPIADSDLLLANRMFWMHYQPRYKLVMGHYDWDIVGWIDEPIILTVLREPLAWFMSLYRYICQEQAMYGDMAAKARANGPLWFAQEHPYFWTNAQTAQLGGVRWSGGGKVDASVYSVARRNLEHCHYVGVTEALDEFVADVHQGMGWALPDVPTRNVTRYEADPTPEVEDLIRHGCHYDYLLYEQARARCNITPA